MISIKQLKSYCCEDVSLIENYEKAMNSREKWVCHHRKEDEGYTATQLRELHLYYGRPASELICMRDEDHRSHHHRNKTVSAATKKVLSRKNKGKRIILNKQILQIDPATNRVVMRYANGRHACQRTGYAFQNISAACRGALKTAYGYRWEFADAHRKNPLNNIKPLF